MSTPLAVLKNIATQLRIDSVRSTTEAGTGHPTSCMSAAEIVATLFFGEMRFDPKDPKNIDNDRFVLSKGHAAPILYAAWAEAGLFPREDLLKLRTIGSDLEGHPTPRLPFVDVATGSLGQGICASVGTALNARRIGSDYRTYVGPRRRRDGGRIGLGSGRDRAVLQARQPLLRGRRQRPRAKPGDAVRAQDGRDCRALVGLRLAHDCRRRPRHPGAAESLRRGARDERAVRRWCSRER